MLRRTKIHDKQEVVCLNLLVADTVDVTLKMLFFIDYEAQNVYLCEASDIC